MVLKEIMYEGMDWIQLAQDSVRWQAAVITVMKGREYELPKKKSVSKSWLVISLTITHVKARKMMRNVSN
jgi:hypothetical protein